MIVAYNHQYNYQGYGLRLKSIVKGVSRAVKPVTRFVTRAAPAAVGGLLIAGPAGAVAGAATGLIGGKNKPLKRLMYGLGAGSVLAAATPAMMKIAPSSKFVADVATNVYSSPIGSKLANLTYSMAFKNATSIAVQKALQQGNISELPQTEKDKLRTGMQLAALAQQKGADEQKISQILDTFFKTGDIEKAAAIMPAEKPAEVPAEKPPEMKISPASLALIGGAVAIPLVMFAMRKK